MVLDEGKYTIRKDSPETVALVFLDIVFLTFLYRVSRCQNTTHKFTRSSVDLLYFTRNDMLHANERS